MIRKFATVSEFRIALSALTLILAGAATVNAQQAQPAPSQQPQQTQQTPDNQQSSSQEATPEEATPRRKTKPKQFDNWSFNVGGGASFTTGTTRQFARGGGGVAAAGVARNYSKYFGFRADFQFDNLPLRPSALGPQGAQASGATSHAYVLMVDPIINIPVTKLWGGYIVGGPSFLRRSGKLDSSTAIPGSHCSPFFNWWGTCFAGSLPLNKNFLKENDNEFGLNVGGGITRKLTPRFELYGEARIIHGSRSGRSTDIRPITIGLRW